MGIPCITVLRFCGRLQHLASAKDTDKRAVDAAICCTIVAVIVPVAEKTGLNDRLQSRREKKTPPFFFAHLYKPHAISSCNGW